MSDPAADPGTDPTPPPTPAKSLDAVAKEIASGTLALDKASAGSDAADLFATVFGLPALAMTSCHMQAADSLTVTFSGAVSVLGMNEPASLLGILLDIPAAGQAAGGRHCMLLIYLPAGTGLATILGSLSRFPAEVASYLTGGLPADEDGDGSWPSPLQSLNLADRRMLFSSLDFGQPRDTPFVLPSNFVGLLGTDVRAGLNLKLQGKIADEFAPALQALSLPVVFTWAALIHPSSRGVRLTLKAELAPCSVHLAPLDLRWIGIELRFALADLGRYFPAVTATASATVGGQAHVASASLDLAAARVDIRLADGVAVPSAQNLGALVGLDRLDGVLPDSSGGYGGLQLDGLSFSLSLQPVSLDSVAFSLSTEKPVEIPVAGMTVAPTASVRVLAPFQADRAVSAMVRGVWTLGTCRFDVMLDLAEKSLDASMMTGTALDGDALARMLPGFQLPKADPPLVLVDFEMSADYGAKTFEAEIDVAGEWEIHVADTAFSVEDIRGQLSYGASTVQDFAFSGRLLIAGLWLDAAITYDGGAWTVRASTVPNETIPLDALVEQLVADLGGVARNDAALPAEFLRDAGGDVAVTDFAVEHSTAGGGSTSLYCALDTTIALGPGFTIDTVFVRMDASASGLALQGKAALGIAGVGVLLAAG